MIGHPKEHWVAKPDWEDPGKGSKYGVLLSFLVSGKNGREAGRIVSVAMTLEEARLERRHLDNYIRDAEAAIKSQRSA